MRLIWIPILTILMLGETALSQPLIEVGDVWRYRIVSELPAAPEHQWQEPGFDDSNWHSGRSGFYAGFGALPEATPIFGLGMDGNTVLFRHPFQVDTPSEIEWLILRIDYQHGFAAFLNGVPLIQQQLGAQTPGQVSIGQISDIRFSGDAVTIDLSEFKEHLREGNNVLAIQVHGQTLNSTSLVFNAELLTDLVRGPFIQELSPHSAKIVWRTHEPSIGNVDYGIGSERTSRILSNTASVEHVLVLPNLSPDTQYTYQVSVQRNQQFARSDIHTFRTFKSSGAIRFAVLADSGKGTRAQYEVAQQIQSWEPDLVLHGGDVVYPDFTAGRADFRCFSVYRKDMASRPYFFAAGNHDVNHGLTPFLSAFHLPENDTPQALHEAEGTAPELYYSFDHGDAHFTVLYAPFFSQYALKEGNPQYQWFENDLRQSNKAWKILLLHHNVFSSSAHTLDDWDRNGIVDQTELQNLIIPLAKKYGVQIVFTGHDHVFERFTPVEGVHFVTSAGGGGGLYSLTRRLPGSAQFWQRYHFTGVTIDKTELKLEAIDTNGTVFDTMSIRQPSPTLPVHQAAWNTVNVEPSPGNESTDHNIPGQSYDLAEPSVPSITGAFSNLGRIAVNHDQEFLYVGIQQLMIRSNQLAYLFVETKATEFPVSLPLPPDGTSAADETALQALRLTDSLQFDDFQPNLLCLLGDEQADGSDPTFKRPSSNLALGQGVYSLETPIAAVPRVRLQQFDHSPLAYRKPNEQNSNLIEIAIPKEAVGLANDDASRRIKLAALVGTLDEGVSPPTLHFDTGFLATRFQSAPDGSILSPVTFELQPNPDRDFDGIENEEESLHRTDPDNPDTDGDQLPDGWELAHQLSPILSTGTDSSTGDPDGDGASNLSEFQSGTDPQDSNSILRLTAAHLGDGIVRLSWRAHPGIRYTLQASDGSSLPFSTIQEWIPSNTSASAQLEHFDLGPPGSTRFFRLIAERLQNLIRNKP